MTDSFDVMPDDLGRAARDMVDLTDAVKTLSGRVDLSGVGTGMAGSASSKTANKLEEQWSQNFSSWAKDGRSHAEALENASRSYIQTDTQSAQLMRSRAGGL